MHPARRGCPEPDAGPERDRQLLCLLSLSCLCPRPAPASHQPTAGSDPWNAQAPSRPLSGPLYLAVFLAGFAAGAAAFLAARTGAAVFAVSVFAGASFAAGGTGSASAVRSTTESSPPKPLGT